MNSRHWTGLANLLQSVTGTAPPETASIEDLLNSLYAYSQAHPVAAGPEPAVTQGLTFGAPNPDEARFWAPAPPPVPGYDPSFTSYPQPPPGPPAPPPTPGPLTLPPGRVPPGQPVPPGNTSPAGPAPPAGGPQPTQPAPYAPSMPGGNYFKSLSATTGRVRTPWASNTSASAYGSSRLSQLMGMGRY